MNKSLLRPTVSKIVLFLLFVALLFIIPLFEHLYLFPYKHIGMWFTVAWSVRLIIFFPIIGLLKLVGPFLRNCGDYTCIPFYWQVICYTVGVFYAYTLSALVINPSTRKKWLNNILSFTSIFLLGLGTLFIIWQFNPNLDTGKLGIQSFYGWLIFGLTTYIIAITILYFAFKKL